MRTINAVLDLVLVALAIYAVWRLIQLMGATG